MKTLQKLAATNKRLQVLQAVLVKDGRAKSTDLDMFISAPCDLESGLYSNMEFKIKSDISPDDFPEKLLTGDAVKTITLSVDDLQWLSKAMSDEETRYYLCGINFSGARLCATDGHRLNLINLEYDLGVDIICPAMAVKFALSLAKEHKLKELTVTLYPRHIQFTAGDTWLITKVIDGTFPPIDRVIPDSDMAKYSFQYTGKSISDALPEIKALAKLHGGIAVKLNSALMFGKKDFPLDIPFPIEIGFNFKYLSDLMSGNMYLNDSVGPVKVVAGNRISVLMPMLV